MKKHRSVLRGFGGQAGQSGLSRQADQSGRNGQPGPNNPNNQPSPNDQKDSKTIRRNFEYHELDTLAEVIEEQAAEGWELTSKTGGVLGFRRSRPRRIKASCEVVYPDYGPEKDEYIAYCQAASWRHIFSDGALQIFETENMDAEPIHTDPAVKLQWVHRQCLVKTVLLSALWILFVLFFMWLFCWDPDYDQYMSGQYLMGLFVGPLCILVSLINIGRYFLWYAGARRAVSRGEHALYRKNLKAEKTENVLEWIYMLAMILAFFAVAWYQWDSREVRLLFFWFLLVAVGALSLIFWMQRRDARRGTGGRARGGKYTILVISLILLFVVGDVVIAVTDFSDGSDPLRLSLEDLGIQTTGQPKRSCEKNGVLFLKQETGIDESPNPEGRELYYVIFTTGDKKIYQKVLDQRFFFLSDGSRDVQQVPAENFRARQAYCDQRDQTYRTWVLLYEDRIISVEVNFDLTKEQQAVIGEKLSGSHAVST